MKLTTLIIIIAFVQVSAASFGQKVTYSHKQASLEQVIREIRIQTGYNVIISTENAKLIQPMDVDFNNTALTDVLAELLKGVPLTYEISEKLIIIKPQTTAPTSEPKAPAPPVTVTGKVLDGTNQAMSGVTVMEKGTDNGTETNGKGEFRLRVGDDNDIVSFSYIGYETQEIPAKDIANGSVITMKPAPQSLHEVVIDKGYYNEKQAFSTGDVGVVTAREIEEQPVSNPLEALEGRVPGLQITQATGLPGSGVTVQIRGQNSIVNGNDPFYVVDGVPYNSEIPTINGKSSILNPVLDGGSPFDYLNPNDIEKIEVLKDADATAIYGTRAANGAILITTKKGKAGKTKVDANIQSGFSTPGRVLQLMNTQQYLQMRHEAFANDGASPDPNTDYDLTYWDTTRSTNWEKVLNQNTAHFTNAQLSLSGGNTNTQFLISTSYIDQTTSLPQLISGENGGADQKGSVHVNLNHNSEDQKFRISFNASYVTDRNTVASEDFAEDAFNLPPDAPSLTNADGTINWAPMAPGQAGTLDLYNPLGTLYIQNHNLTTNLVANSTISYNIFSNLKIQASLGYNNTQSDQYRLTPSTAADPAAGGIPSGSYFQTYNVNGWIIEPQINYDAQVGKGVLNVLLGSSFSESNSSAQYITAEEFTSDALLDDPQAAGSSAIENSASQYKYEGFYGRLNYNLKDKYLLNITGRRDGSSRFGPGRQFGNFGSVGAGWIFSKEKFIENGLPWLSFGKLRASYGTTGNDQIGDYQFLDVYSPTRYSFEGITGLYPKTLSNPDLAWETDQKLEGGIELGFLHDQINVQASYYRNRSNNQLLGLPVSTVTGYATVPENFPATVQNKGWEFLAHSINIKSKNFSWSSSFNISFNRNKLLAFPDFSTSGFETALEIGQPISMQKVFQLDGVNPTTGLYQFKSATGQDTYSPDYSTDRIKKIDITPKFFGGLSNTLTYKSLSLDFLFQFVKQTGINFFGLDENMPGTLTNFPAFLLADTWQRPGDIAKYQQFSKNYGSQAALELNYAQESNFIYSDASFIRLKNVSLSWTCPPSWKTTLHVENCRLFVQGENLLTISNYLGLDPESQTYLTSPYRTLTIGLQITP